MCSMHYLSGAPRTLTWWLDAAQGLVPQQVLLRMSHIGGPTDVHNSKTPVSMEITTLHTAHSYAFINRFYTMLGYIHSGLTITSPYYIYKYSYFYSWGIGKESRNRSIPFTTYPTYDRHEKYVSISTWTSPENFVQSLGLLCGNLGPTSCKFRANFEQTW